jgi:endonuclease-3
MPRKSPRARRKPGPAPRLPGKSRPRTTPGKTRAAARGKTARAAARRAIAGVTRHTPKGARATRVATAPARRKPVPAARRAVVREPKHAAVAVTRDRSARSPRRAPPDPARIAAILNILEDAYPDARTALHHENPLQLLVATILSAQCTDERVNMVTPALFARFPDAASLAGADRVELEALIRSTGFYRNKAKAIQTCCADIVAQHGGEVPRTLEALTALHGVGRKTANVVLGSAFGIPGIVVDTHVHRLARRLGLTRESDPVKIEFALMPIIPRDRWSLFSHWLILHGRRVCVARKPRCSTCPLAPHCPRIGVTASQ